MAETLQEFLVKLSYKSEGENRYLAGIKNAESSVMRLGKTLTLGGLALGGALAKYASNMEQIGFVARRTGTHVKSLMAFEAAGASLGSSAEGAKESLEGLAAFMRNTPGSGGFLAELGVKTKDAKGHALDTVEIMKELGTSFQKMPTFMAHQYASLLGISDNMMLALRSGKVNALVDKFQKPLEGAKLDKVAVTANQAMIAGRVVVMKKEAIEAKLAEPVLQKFVQADAATGGTSTSALAVAGAVLGGGIAISFAKKLLGVGGGSLEGGASKGLLKFLGPLGAVAGILANPTDLADDSMPKTNVSEPQRHTISLLRNMGFTDAEASGIAANFTRESGMNPGIWGDGGKAYGVGQWHQDRQAYFKKLMGKDIKGSSLDDQVHFAGMELRNHYPDVLKRMEQDGTAARAASLFSTGYERPAASSAEAAKRGALAQTIYNQIVTIHVSGAKDASETARKVKEELRMAAHNNSMATH